MLGQVEVARSAAQASEAGRLRVHALGVPILNSRTAAIRHMLQEAPASVIASMLGYQQTSAENIAAAAGTRRQRYTVSRTGKLNA